MREPGLLNLAAAELAEGVRAGRFSALELAEAYLVRIEEQDTELGAYLAVATERVRRAARRVDEKRTRGEELGRLAGVPYAVKDNICTSELPTTCASRILSEYRPPYDATVIQLCQAQDAVVLGKTNMDEFAMGSSCENSSRRLTTNPWDIERVPGGSSGGSAAAVAGRQASFALGSDTGGSVRQPASLCGVVGCKPTYGAISRYGLVAFASSLDQIGPLTRNVRDCALVLDVIAAKDPRDATSLAHPSAGRFSAGLAGGVSGWRVGLPREYLGQGIEEGVRRAVTQAAGILEALGARVEECSLPHTAYALPAYYIIAPAEASANLARYDGVRYGPRAEGVGEAGIEDLYARTRGWGFGPEVKRRIMLGTYVLSAGYYDAYYLKALKVRRLIKEDFDRAFSRYDLLLTPTSPTVAFPIGARAHDPLDMYMADLCTVPVNLAGLPAVSLPAGLADGLPVGIQLIAPAFSEDRMLRAALALEEGLPSLGPVPDAVGSSPSRQVPRRVSTGGEVV